MTASNRRENKKKMGELIEIVDKIEKAEQAGDLDCRELRWRFRRLYSEILAQLDGVEAPFQKGDFVRVLKRDILHMAPLELGHPYRVHELEYDGDGVWMIVLDEMKDRPDHVRFGHHQFEKVTLVPTT